MFDSQQYCVLAGSVVAGAVAGWLLGRSQHHSNARRTLAGNHSWMTHQELCFVGGLIASGHGHLLSYWPTAGTNDEMKRELLMMVTASISNSAETIETLRINMIPKPIAKRVPYFTERHGDARDDPYYWLRDDSRLNPFALNYLKEENAYTNAILVDTQQLQSIVFDEMRQRIREDDQSAPLRVKNYDYYTRRVAGRSYKLHCRRRVVAASSSSREQHFEGRNAESGASEEILLDENVEAKPNAFFSVEGLTVSPDEKLIVYFQDDKGHGCYKLRIRQIRSGRHLVRDSKAEAWKQCAWSSDSKTVFYLKVDALGRPHKVFSHCLGECSSKDKCLYTEDDPNCHLSIYKTRDLSTICICSESKFFTECRVLDAARPDDALEVVLRRTKNVFYWLQRYHNSYIFQIQDKHRLNSEITIAPVNNPDDQTVLIPCKVDCKIEDFVLNRGYLTVFCRKRGLQTAFVYSLEDRDLEKIPVLDRPEELKFEEAVFSLRPGPQGDFDSEFLRLVFSSLTTPESIIDQNLRTFARSIVKMDSVLGSYDARMYRSERAWAQAFDGGRIPISIVYKVDTVQHDRTNPLVLEVYGAHERSLDPVFSSERLSLLCRGVVYAIAHIRGGGEMGRSWYENARLLSKKTAFTDTEACARHLVDLGYCSPQKVCICGSAAGGLTVAAVLNKRPELFHAAILRAPSVDLLTSLIDKSKPFSAEESGDLGEYGDPENEEQYRYIKSYSPVDNITELAYPHMLITTRYHDSRVGFWEPAKYTAKIRCFTTSEKMVLLSCSMNGILSAEGRRLLKYKETAQEYAFLLKTLGLLNPRGAVI